MSEQIFEQLESEGLLARSSGGEWVPTRRWKAAVARAALWSMRADENADDPKVTYAWALIDLLGDEVPPRRVAAMIEALLSIEHPVATATASHPA